MRTLEQYGHFVGDECKMHDFLLLNKKEFLESYCYLTEEDYRATYETIMAILEERGWDFKMADEFDGETRDMAYEEHKRLFG